MKRLAVLALLLITPAQADQRQEVSVNQFPYSTVARVGFGHGWCSAVLIGPDLAATAAHCLWNKITGRQMGAGALNVVVGWNRGMVTDGAGVAEVVLPPSWVPEQVAHYGQAQAQKDWALLRLDKPLGKTAGWLAVDGTIQTGQAVVAVGYGEDRKHVAVAHSGCHMQQQAAPGLWLHSCDAVHGDSGGPIFTAAPLPHLIAINVARLGENRGAAVAASQFQDIAHAMGAPAQSWSPP